MIPWYGRLSRKPHLCTGANHSHQPINTKFDPYLDSGVRWQCSVQLRSMNLQDHEIDEHTTTYAPTRKGLLDMRNQYMLRCTPQLEGTSSLMIERCTNVDSVRDTVPPISSIRSKNLSKLLSNTQIPSPPSTPDTHTSQPSETIAALSSSSFSNALIRLSTSFACPAPSKQTQPKALTSFSQTHSPPASSPTAPHSH
jgi:hypothetical protein